MPKRILCVADVKGWAWWHMCKGFQKWCQLARRNHRPEIFVIDQQEFGLLTRTLKPLLMQFDSILQCSWMEATHPTERNLLSFRRNCTLLASHGVEFNWSQRPLTIPEKIATPTRNRGLAKKSLPRFDRVLCVSKALVKVAESLGANAVYAPPGVCHETFEPRRDHAPVNTNCLTIGWCGQHKGVTKGYREVLKPLMLRLPQHEFSVIDRSAESPLTQGEMAQWYRSLDVYLSTSCSEGFQMPPLEAMACGIPVIATRAGAIDELVTDKTGWVLPGWSTAADAEPVVEALANTINAMHPDDLYARGEASRRRVESYFTWELQNRAWEEFLLA